MQIFRVLLIEDSAAQTLLIEKQLGATKTVKFEVKAVSYFEWVQGLQNFTWSLEEINNRLHKIMTDAFHRTLMRMQRDKLDTMRTAALIEGIARVQEAKLSRGIFP